MITFNGRDATVFRVAVGVCLVVDGLVAYAGIGGGVLVVWGLTRSIGRLRDHGAIAT